MDLLIALDELDELVHKAPRFPLTGEAMLDPETATAAVARVREALLAQYPAAAGPYMQHLEQLRRLVSEAKPVPLSRRARVGAGELEGALDTLRTDLPEAIHREHLAAEQRPPPS